MAHNRRVLIGTRFPVVTTIIIGGCLAGFIAELFQGKGLGEFLLRFGVVPAQLVAYFKAVPGTSFDRSVLPFFSSLFLHGGFLHLVVNLAFLWIVGDVVEDVLGRVRFIVLFVFGAAAELIVRMGVAPSVSGYASVGVSGAVAALIGGYIVVMIWLSRAAEEERKSEAPAEGSPGPASFAAAVPLTSRLSLLLGGLCWFPLQLLNRYVPLAATCQTVEDVPWPSLLASFVLGAFLVSLSGPRHGSFTTSEAVAFPNEETAPLQA